MLNQVQHDGCSLGQSFYATTSNLLPVPVEGSLLAKEVPVLRWGEVFLLPQTIRSLRLSKGVCMLKSHRPFESLRDHLSTGSGTVWCYRGMFFAQGLKTEKATGEPVTFFG